MINRESPLDFPSDLAAQVDKVFEQKPDTGMLRDQTGLEVISIQPQIDEKVSLKQRIRQIRVGKHLRSVLTTALRPLDNDSTTDTLALGIEDSGLPGS